MFGKKLTTRELAICSALATVSAVTQLLHIGYQSPQFGMWIDIVATSWIIAQFLFGIRGALVTSLLGVIIITLFAPETWLGASMKWAATMPLWLCLYLWTCITRKTAAAYQSIQYLIFPVIFGLIIRSIISLPLNYYYAIPIWTGMGSQNAIANVPWYIIVIFNVLQGICDIFLAWLLVFRFNLARFANWNK